MLTVTTPGVEGGVTSFTLPSGTVVIVDEADLALLEQYRWYDHNGNGKPYVRGYLRGTRPGFVLMHRLLMGASKGVEVGHINEDGLDNRRSNLRLCSHGSNGANLRLRRTSLSGYRGVSWDRGRRKWRASITVNGTTRRLGRFADAWEAAAVYNAAAAEAWGKYAQLNERKPV